MQTFQSIFLCMSVLYLTCTNPLWAQEIREVDDGLAVAPTDWPWWRGPQRNGTASPDQRPPIEFGESKNVVWKTQVPGRGHGSPTVFGDRIFVATADEDSGAQFVVCYRRETGDLLWKSVVHTSGGMQKNKKASAGSSTVACDGQRVFICFPCQDALYATALDLDGRIVWQKKISDYVVHQGYGSSAALYRDLVIVTADNKGGGAIAALNRATGDFVWRRERPEKPNYPSPILVNIGGKDQIILVGCDMVVSYDPLSGEINWQTEGATTECVTSTLTDGNLIYTSGGYPENHMSAIKADGTGELVWANKTRLYVPSLVVRDGYLYGVLDAGIATCWKADSGEEMWKARLGGTFSSSPVLVGERIFVSNEAGEIFVFEANPREYREISRNQLGDQVFATPTIVGGRIYHRVAKIDPAGERQEWLYCFGQ